MMPLAAIPTSSDERRLTVLLVDDSSAVRQELCHLLRLTGMFDVVGEAEDGIQAVRLAEELSPDVIIMDLDMPSLNGLEATRLIKSRPSSPRVVILSVHAGQSELSQASAAGADQFVIKGSDFQILVNAILGWDGPFNSSEKGEIS